MPTFTPGEVVPPDDARIVLEGQWGHQPGVAVTVNSGSRILFAFRDGPLQLLFDVEGLTSAPHLWITVDEGEPVLHVLDRPVVELSVPQGKPGHHRVEVAVKDVDERVNRWKPPFGSAVIFAGLLLDRECRLRLSGRPDGPRMEFYGDSITQGVRALGAELGPAGSDGTRSFAYLTARAFGASSYQVGFGRQGVVRPGAGEVPAAPESFGWNFAGSPVRRPGEPEVVVINFGANDQVLEDAYGNYLRRVRAAYPTSKLVALSPFSGIHAAEIEAAVKATGDPDIVYVATTGWLGPEDYTDTTHPSVGGHAKVAARLVDELERHTGLGRRSDN